MSTPASRSGAHVAAHDLEHRVVDGEPAWMIGARSGHGDARRGRRAGRPRARRARTRRSRPSPASPAGRSARCGSSSTACTASGPTTPSTSTPSVVWSMRARSAGSAAARRRVAGHDEQLGAPREQLLGDLQREALELLGGRSPYGKRAVSPRYRKSSCGSCDEQLVQHGEPADPGVEDRDRAVCADRRQCAARRRAYGQSRRAAGTTVGLTCRLHALDRLLELTDDGLRDAAALEALAGGDDARQHGCDEQDQRRRTRRCPARPGRRPAAAPPRSPRG